MSPQYIEDVIPQNNLKNILKQLEDENSPESYFLKRLTYSVGIFNGILLTLYVAVIFIFTRAITLPIHLATKEIQNMQIGKYTKKIEYSGNDEIGLLVASINNLNTKLAIQEDIRSRLLADISHELKTPITSIQCYLEGISDGVIKLGPKNLSAIIDEMNRLIQLVNKIMEYEKFENEDVHIQKESIHPYKFFQ